MRILTAPRLHHKAIALATFGSGVLSLHSLVRPALAGRLALLHQLFPVEFPSLSRFLTMVVGFALIISSFNIYKRKRRAFQAVLVLACLSVVFHLTKGIDYEEALVSMLLVILLIAGRRTFTVRSAPLDLRSVSMRLGSALTIGLAYGVAGFWFLDPRDFGIDFSMVQAASETLRYLALSRDPALLSHTSHAAWFLDSLSLMTTVMFGYIAILCYRPVVYRMHTLPQEHALAAAIARAHGRSALDFFKLWPDKSYFFSASKQAFVAYRVAGGFALALADPVGPQNEIESIVREFSVYCADNGWGLAFYETLPDFVPIYERCGFSRLRLGEDAVVDLTTFTLEGSQRKGLRTAVQKVERQGIEARRFEPPQTDEMLAQLQSVSDEWLQIPGRRERQFTLGRFDIEYVRNCPVMAAVSDEGAVQAFVNVVPSYRRGEISIDLMRRRGEAPNGVMDFLLVKLMLDSRNRKFERFNLGMAPMSGFRVTEDASPEERAIHFFFQHLNFVFSFSGLRAYKAKFATRWEPCYVIHRAMLDLPRVGLALARVSEIR
jgi:phosphatidylglycerol lysyltransferase